jgi:hypothetical protein
VCAHGRGGLGVAVLTAVRWAGRRWR